MEKKNADLKWWDYILLTMIIVATIAMFIGIGYGFGKDAGHKEIINSEKWIVDFEKPDAQYDYRIYFHVKERVYVGYGYIG